jgi:hypothetical protein
VHTSVPPLIEPSQTSGPTSVATHPNASGDSGAPVEPIAPSASRRASAFGSRFAFMHACRNGALTPRYVSRSSCASRHSVPRSGCAGLPSYSTTVEPTKSPPTRKFHIIHPVVVNQKNRSPGPRSRWSASDFRCSRTIPPCPCTIAFGEPVVPDEYRIQSGCSNATGSNSSGAGVPVSSSHVRVATSVRSPSPEGMTTHVVPDSAATISRTTAVRSNHRPP